MVDFYTLLIFTTTSYKFNRFFSVLSSSSDDGVESVEYLAEDLRGPVNRKRRRRSRRNGVEHFLRSLVMEVMEKQEEMHKQLIEMIEKIEKERVLREEAWKQLEIERHKRDEAVRAEEISRSLALISFLQNLLGEEEIQIPEPGARQNVEENGVETNSQPDKKGNPNNKTRWPEAEVQALIALRTALDHKFRLSGAKGSTWEEISAGMQMMGYNRTEKKCKEKWENINKYFKRLTESGKQQLPNGKSCQYLHNLDLLYRNGLVNPGVGVSITNVDGEDEKSERDSESL